MAIHSSHTYRQKAQNILFRNVHNQLNARIYEEAKNMTCFEFLSIYITANNKE